MLLCISAESVQLILFILSINNLADKDIRGFFAATKKQLSIIKLIEILAASFTLICGIYIPTSHSIYVRSHFIFIYDNMI